MVFSELDDMNSSSKAEEIFKEVAESYSKLNNKKTNEKEIKINEELVKYYLKQEKFQVRFSDIYYLFYFAWQ